MKGRRRRSNKARARRKPHPRRRNDGIEAGSLAQIERIGRHIETHLGPIAMVVHEIVSELVHIDLHHVAPTRTRPFHMLITSGMSGRPMAVPRGAEDFRFAELMISLPPSWPLQWAAWRDEAHFWPIRWLKRLARLPHENGTWIGHGHTVPNGDPPRALARSTKLSGFIVLPSLVSSNRFHTLEIGSGKTVRFYAVLPLYAEEMDLKLRRGADALIELLDRAGVHDVVNVDRPCVAAPIPGARHA
jgi:hypothetical protein